MKTKKGTKEFFAGTFLILLMAVCMWMFLQALADKAGREVCPDADRHGVSSVVKTVSSFKGKQWPRTH